MCDSNSVFHIWNTRLSCGVRVRNQTSLAGFVASRINDDGRYSVTTQVQILSKKIQPVYPPNGPRWRPWHGGRHGCGSTSVLPSLYVRWSRDFPRLAIVSKLYAQRHAHHRVHGGTYWRIFGTLNLLFSKVLQLKCCKFTTQNDVVVYSSTEFGVTSPGVHTKFSTEQFEHLLCARTLAYGRTVLEQYSIKLY